MIRIEWIFNTHCYIFEQQFFDPTFSHQPFFRSTVLSVNRSFGQPFFRSTVLLVNRSNPLALKKTDQKTLLKNYILSTNGKCFSHSSFGIIELTFDTTWYLIRSKKLGYRLCSLCYIVSPPIHFQGVFLVHILIHNTVIGKEKSVIIWNQEKKISYLVGKLKKINQSNTIFTIFFFRFNWY